MGKKDKHKKKNKKKGLYSAKTADRHMLYELAVQDVENEIVFLDETYTAIRGYPARTLREDFAGTTAAACEWVRCGADRQAWAVDIDKQVLDWGRKRHVAQLDDDEQKRIELIEGDVLDVNTPLADIIIGFNFSYFIFKTREQLRAYFEKARRNLKPDGLFFLDCFGGSEAYDEVEEETDLDGFTYVWDQDVFSPVTSNILCHIHFHFPDGTKMRRAFSYDWRLWTLAEIRELLEEAGFSKSTVYWEGTDDDGDGDGNFEPVDDGEADPAWISYVVAER